MIVCNHQLTLNDLTQVQSLAAHCQQADGNHIPIYSNLLLQRRNLPCNLLYYHQGKLIAFLSVFFFYDDACELTFMVDPAWRRQGIAARLIATIKPVIETSGVHGLYYASPQGLNDAWLSGKQLSYDKTEYDMQWQGGDLIKTLPDNMQVYQAKRVEDIPSLVMLDVACFHTDPLEMENRFQRLLLDSTYALLFISCDKQIIGKAHLHQDPEKMTLSDIAIFPAYQNRGLGQALINYCIQYSRSISDLPLRLEVDSHNQNALHIYLKVGFKIRNAWDLWKTNH